MSNSTVFAYKADTSDMDSKLKGIKASAEATFLALEASTKKAQKAQDTYTASTKAFERTLRTVKSQIAVLNAEKAKNGSLSQEQATKLSTLEAKEKKLESVYKRSIRALKTKIIEAKRDVATQKTSLNSYETLTRSIEKNTTSKNKNTIATNKQITSLRKEDAERRALGTTVVRHIRRLESLAVAYFAVSGAYKSTLGAGVELNRQYENMELGLSALISAKTEAVDATGKETDALTKFLTAQQQTKDILSDIKREATETPATFSQMVGFYQQAIGHALAAGSSFGESLQEISDNTITLTKRMSSLGSSVGMSMDLIDEEIRSLMSGDISSDSKLALILFGSPTKANAAIKEAKKSVNGLRDLLNEKLVPFEVLENIETFDKNLNKLVAEIQIVQKAASEPIFDDLKDSFAELTIFLQANGNSIAESFTDVYIGFRKFIESLSEVSKEPIEAISAAADVMSSLGDSVLDIESSFTGASQMLTVFSGLLTNAVNLIQLAAIGYEGLYSKLTDGAAFDAWKTANKARVSELRNEIKTLDELNQKAITTGKNIREIFGSTAFKDSKQLGAFADKKVIDIADLGVQQDALTELYKHLRDSEHRSVNDKKILREAYLAALNKLNASQATAHIRLLTQEVDAEEQSATEKRKIAKKLLDDKKRLLELSNIQETTGLDGLDKAQTVLEQQYRRDLELYKDFKGSKKILFERFVAETSALSDAQIKKDSEAKYAQSRKDYEAEKTLRKLSIGLISDERERKLALAELNHQDRLDEIEHLYKMGKLTKTQYEKRLNLENTLHEKLVDGYSMMSTVIKSAADTMESSMQDFFDMTSEGFLDFGDLAQDVLNQIMQQMIKMAIIKPLVSGITGMATGMMFAKGDSFSGSPSLSAHSNSVVSQPTPFFFANGGVPNLGIMGEAGSEAIMPLTRTADGDLGVRSIGGGGNVILNIENNTSQAIDAEMISEMMKTDERGEEQKVINIVLKNVKTNSAFRNALRS